MDGYKLLFPGYDYLSICKFQKQGLLSEVKMKIGVGKESDIYLVKSAEGKLMVLKLARLGWTSFKSVLKNRDYIKNQEHFNWLYLSKLASQKEFLYMKTLYEEGFPVPVPVANDRHAILMSFINGFPLNKVKELSSPEKAFNILFDILERFGSMGLVHGDFNEFNIMIDQDSNVTVIDFP